MRRLVRRRPREDGLHLRQQQRALEVHQPPRVGLRRAFGCPSRRHARRDGRSCLVDPLHLLPQQRDHQLPRLRFLSEGGGEEREG
ncbi:hypothetical protein AB1Y20_008325 [Prymnesium parvum]|uniref:Uncharacterized protein n=1 Tax=Prymnesium parvum TaxID=97485 RepID=A0AB34IW92_PRYPA